MKGERLVNIREGPENGRNATAALEMSTHSVGDGQGKEGVTIVASLPKTAEK